MRGVQIRSKDLSEVQGLYGRTDPMSRASCLKTTKRRNPVERMFKRNSSPSAGIEATRAGVNHVHCQTPCPPSREY